MIETSFKAGWAVFVTVVTLFAMPGVTRADLAEGVHAFDNRQYDEAYRAFLPLAEQGNPIAQTRLGTMYRSGVLGQSDMPMAARWFERAAEHDYPEAHYNLGLMYLYHEALAPGVPASARALERVAVTHFARAAEYGHAQAQLYLGHLLAKGKAVRRDPIHAFKWFQLAAWQRSSLAAAARDQLAATMRPEQLAEAKILARDWQPLELVDMEIAAAETGHKDSGATH